MFEETPSPQIGERQKFLFLSQKGEGRFHKCVHINNNVDLSIYFKCNYMNYAKVVVTDPFCPLWDFKYSL